MICAMDAEHDEFFNAPPTTEGNTMSIEAKIEANTAALVALTAAILASATGGRAPAVPAAQVKTEAKTDPAKTTAPAGAALDYEKDVKPLALRVAKEKGRDALVSILGTFKVAQANLLKPEQWNAFVTECNKALS